VTPRLALALMARESRGSLGKVVFFVACLAVGVAAVVAVAGLSSGIDRGLRREARALLAGDLIVRSQKPIPDAVVKHIDGFTSEHPGTRSTEMLELATVVSTPRGEQGRVESALVELKAVGSGWPFYGQAVTEPARPLGDLLADRGVLVAPDLAQKLDLREGSVLNIGGTRFTVRGRIVTEPDRLGVGIDLGPRILISRAALGETGLEAFGSRIGRRILVKLPEGSAPSLAETLERSIEALIPADAGIRVETYVDAQPGLRRGFENASRFLGLVALVSLVLGGIGVAETVRAWLASRLDAIAVLKCLGLRPREVTALYAGETALLGLTGSVVGAAAGTAVLAIAPRLLADVLPAVPIDAFSPSAILRGLFLGTGTAILFSVAPLSSLRLVPPLRVLRRDAEPLRAGRLARVAVAGTLVAGIFAAAWLQSGSPRLAAGFTGGMIAAGAALAGAAWVTTRAVERAARGRLKVVLRHGLAAVARPGAGTLPAITALGLGVLVVVGMLLVQRGLVASLESDRPEDAPNVFLVDLQSSQWPRVESILQASGATGIRTVPIVTARLASIDGVTAAELAERRDGKDGRGRGRWVFTREQNLTWMHELPQDNEIVAGRLWSDPARAEISIEEEFAADMGVKLGSTVVFDVQGVPVEVTVTSLRKVGWRSFGINFFLVVEPGVLDDAPQRRVATARLPAGMEQAAQDRVAAEFPNVVVLKVREIVEKVAKLLDRIGLAIRILGGFAIAAGIAILAGAVGAQASRRGREVALLKTLGSTRAGVVGTFSVEFALLGLVAGLVGTVGGGVLAWAVITRGMELPWTWRPGVLLLAPLGAVLLAVAAGITASLGALRKRPIEVLRAE
jgi:putative ABC transport system permease protein